VTGADRHVGGAGTAVAGADRDLLARRARVDEREDEVADRAVLRVGDDHRVADVDRSDTSADAVARVVVLGGGLRGDETASRGAERDGQGEGDGRRDSSFHG